MVEDDDIIQKLKDKQHLIVRLIQRNTMSQDEQNEASNELVSLNLLLLKIQRHIDGEDFISSEYQLNFSDFMQNQVQPQENETQSEQYTYVQEEIKAKMNALRQNQNVIEQFLINVDISSLIILQ